MLETGRKDEVVLLIGLLSCLHHLPLDYQQVCWLSWVHSTKNQQQNGESTSNKAWDCNEPVQQSLHNKQRVCMPFIDRFVEFHGY